MISATGRHVAFLIYPHFNLIDLSGPLDAFALANEMAPDAYASPSCRSTAAKWRAGQEPR
jgi:transcriptional regulator GlxA family with amidase domain